MRTSKPVLNDLRISAINANLSSPVLFLERQCSLVSVLGARASIKIEENYEPLQPIPSRLFSFNNSHPYVTAGAPYDSASPYFLRQGVLDRLIKAQRALDMENAGYRLKIIDGFRPQAVQIYMRQFEHDKIARDTGLNPNNLTPDEDRRIWDKVDSVWAKPSSDPSNPPPPHSTGAAIDLTIINSSGQELNMGSDFDEVSDKILPNFYLNQDDFDSVEIHKNRDLLNRVMTSAGFHRLPHEWWHFSYGDQMWALIEAVTTGIERVAIYGEVNQAN